MALTIPQPIRVSDLPASTAQREARQTAEILRALSVLFDSDQIVELRALNATQGQRRAPMTYRGYYDEASRTALAKDALSITASGVYVTIQQINPDLHARAFNRSVFCGKGDPSTSDGDVLGFRWLFVDLDPKRPSGISSSDAELLGAHEHALHVRDALMGKGWPAPVWATSGNGSHLLWRIDLPRNDDRFSDQSLVEKALKALDAEFSIPTIKIDTTNFNPSRISKLYGTLARKGDDMPGRPHRLSHLLDVPDEIGVVSREQLEALAATAPPPESKSKTPAKPAAKTSQASQTTNKPKPKGALTTLDVPAWAAKIPELSLLDEQDWRDGKKWKVEPCPCDRGCPDGAAIIQDGSGRLAFKCHHDNCKINATSRDEGTTQWATFRGLMEQRLPAEQQRSKRPAPKQDPIKINDDGVVIEVDDADFDAADAEGWHAETPAPVDEAMGVPEEPAEAEREPLRTNPPPRPQDLIRDSVLGPPDEQQQAPQPPPKKRKEAKPKPSTPKPKGDAPCEPCEGEEKPIRDASKKNQIQVDHSLEYVRDTIKHAPVSEWAVIPGDFGITKSGYLLKTEEIDGDTKTTTVSYRPMFITARLTDAENMEHVRLSWPRDGGWVHRIVPRSVSADRSKLIALADYAAPVDTGNASSMVTWLQAYEAENINILPRSKVSKQQGWQKDGGFLMGDLYIAPDGIACNAADDDPLTWDSGRWTYAPDDAGAQQDASAFREKEGTFEAWKEALQIAKKYPRVLFSSFYVSLASPLLKLMGHRSLIVDISGKAGSGKTSMFHLAASVWGYPSELDGRVIRSWDGKLAGIEGHATARGHMPVFFDDSKSADPLVLQQIIYKLVAGQTKMRGAPLGGSQAKSSWRTVFLSTGEARLIDFAAASDAGARQRVISLHGQHWGGRTPDVNRVREIVGKNYGHVGQQWISWLVKNKKEKLGEWKDKYGQYREKFERMAGSDTSAQRLGYDLAMFRLAAELAHEALDLPFAYDDTVEAMMGLVKDTTQESQAAEVALRRVWEWCVRYEDRFEGRRDDKAPAPVQGWAGEWKPGKKWDQIVLNKDIVREILSEASFKFDSVYDEWLEEKWAMGGKGTSKFPRVAINGERARRVVIYRSAIDAVCIGYDDDEPPKKPTPPSPKTPPTPPAAAPTQSQSQSATEQAPQTESESEPVAETAEPPIRDWDEVPTAIAPRPPKPEPTPPKDPEPQPKQMPLRPINPTPLGYGDADEDEDEDDGYDPTFGLSAGGYRRPKAVE